MVGSLGDEGRKTKEFIAHRSSFVVRHPSLAPAAASTARTIAA
jgi:hypothetical protein